MSINFLTEEQCKRYGRFNADPDETQLGGSFHLDATARCRAMVGNGARNQLGWAVQLGTVRFLGTFLTDPTNVPAVVVDYVAAQLGLDPADLKGYDEREARWDHLRTQGVARPGPLALHPGVDHRRAPRRAV